MLLWLVGGAWGGGGSSFLVCDCGKAGRGVTWGSVSWRTRPLLTASHPGVTPAAHSHPDSAPTPLAASARLTTGIFSLCSCWSWVGVASPGGRVRAPDKPLTGLCGSDRSLREPPGLRPSPPFPHQRCDLGSGHLGTETRPPGLSDSLPQPSTNFPPSPPQVSQLARPLQKQGGIHRHAPLPELPAQGEPRPTHLKGVTGRTRPRHALLDGTADESTQTRTDTDPDRRTCPSARSLRRKRDGSTRSHPRASAASSRRTCSPSGPRGGGPGGAPRMGDAGRKVSGGRRAWRGPLSRGRSPCPPRRLQSNPARPPPQAPVPSASRDSWD